MLDENELRSAKMDQNQGRFLGMCLDPKHRDQMPVPKHSDRLLVVRVLRDEGGETHIIRWFDGAASDVNAILTQINRSKEQSLSNKFQMLVTTLYEEKSDIVLTKARKKFEFVTTSERTVEKLSEWYCNRALCTHLVSLHCTRFALKDLRTKRERESSMSKNKAGSRSLSQAFQRETRVSGQVVNTRVLERPDKWDGRKRA